MKSSLAFFCLLFVVAAFSPNLRASPICDVATSQDLIQAVDAYNQSETDCHRSIRFLSPAVLSMTEPLVITRLATEGMFGTSIRSCIAAGPIAEEGCRIENDDDVILDFSQYTRNGGDCPIRVATGARFDFIRFKVLAPNADRVFCDDSGNPIPIDDRTNDAAWINRVTIEETPSEPVACDLRESSSAGRSQLSWSTERANHLRLLRNGREILNLDESQEDRIQSGTLSVVNLQTADYTVHAWNARSACLRNIHLEGRLTAPKFPFLRRSATLTRFSEPAPTPSKKVNWP